MTVNRSKGGCGQEKEIGYAECALAMMRMWIDNVLTDGEYYKIMDKLNKHWNKTRKETHEIL